MMKKLVKTLCLSSLFAIQFPIAVAATTPETNSSAAIEKILERQQALENEVRSLRAQVQKLEQEKRNRSTYVNYAPQSTTSVKAIKKSSTPTTKSKIPSNIKHVPVNEENTDLSDDDTYLEQQPTQQAHDPHSPPPPDSPKDVHYRDFFDAVVVSPFLGLSSGYDADNLMVNISSINTDLRVARQRQRLQEEAEKEGVYLPTHPIIEISGALESQLRTQWPYSGGNRGDIDLTYAELDVASQINRWASGFLAFEFDNSPNFSSVNRTENSNVFLNRGFINIGNLTVSPFYGTIGQFYIPTGVYRTHMISSSLPKLMARTKARAALIGFQERGEDAWNGSVFVWHGETAPRHSNHTQYGLDLEKTIRVVGADSNFGIGFNSNIAEATGFQDGGSTGFDGFNDSNTSEKIQHNVPAFDIHGSAKRGNFDVLGELVVGLRRFSQEDLTFNNGGALPMALDVEGAYHFNILDYATVWGVGYQASKDMLALSLPSQRYITTISTSIWKGTIESLEYRHDINYGKGKTAAGLNADGVLTPVDPGDQLGKSSDTITAQIGIYF